jgi:putative transposase
MENQIIRFRGRSLRLPRYDYSQAGAYFITICTNKRKCLFRNILNNDVNLNEIENIVLDFWYSLPRKYSNIQLDEFVIMPNHVHGIIFITDVAVIDELSIPNAGAMPVGKRPLDELSLRERRNMILPKAVGYFKMNSAKAINQKLVSSGSSLWQRNYYEHIIRNEDELDRIRQYIIIIIQ